MQWPQTQARFQLSCPESRENFVRYSLINTSVTLLGVLRVIAMA